MIGDNNEGMTIPQHLNPSHMDYLKAKSKNLSRSEGRQETLAEHTWAVLCKLSDQYRF